ncbi:TetR/AcrR family transcriptional regulator [Variovorax sp. J31P207]|uniref:TetR/AcrR family transcriptional regulator n=1 Tax=Variovorax sp. J31P207 TaxID=3053510 RepID=UPI00257750CB|nr:TetR/AcrR family transcriptional regulator [Variovorax sp. J31P207]MDM0065895.1 TetR/AcrR family transcriptional regulator [Variovorax sp. J31P207]
MARGRAAGYDDQRDMILEHAALLFANRGYSATSMNQVAEACGFSKALLYHYYRDKYSLLVSIAENHVSRLEDLVSDVERQGLGPAARLRELIRRFVEEYAGAKHAHRVLTEDVKFLEEDDRERVLGTQRTVVAGFARVVAELRPDLQQAALAKPLTMLLFGMINWMFIWMRPDGELDYDAMAPVVADLFLGGLPAVQTPLRVTAIDD